MIVNLIEDDRANLRAGIGLPTRCGDLQRKLLLSRADHITAKRAAVGRGAKRKPMTVTRQVRVRVARKEIHIITV